MNDKHDDDANLPTWRIVTGHAIQVLQTLPDRSVQCCVTSPQYWGLRNYKTDPQVWGGDADCTHTWGGAQITRGSSRGVSQGCWCTCCSAWYGHLGLEPTPELFIAHLVDIFYEVWRVLRDDGVLAVNIGDSYNAAGRDGHGTRNGYKQGTNRALLCGADAVRPSADGLKRKYLVGIPWMLAFALRADGWFLRSDIIWAKGISFCDDYFGAVMPESVTDRPTKAHEYVFLFAKSKQYYWDAEAIKERQRGGRRNGDRNGDGDPVGMVGDGRRNVRSVWAINPEPFDGEFCTACRTLYDGSTKKQIRVVPRGISGKHRRDSGMITVGSSHQSGSFGGGPSPEDTDESAQQDERICPCGRSDAWLSHFATFPLALVVPIVKAGMSEYGACAQCGAPYVRRQECTAQDGRSVIVDSSHRMAYDASGAPLVGQNNPMRGIEDMVSRIGKTTPPQKRMIGWRPTCLCDGVGLVKPCVVIDPFSGTGTTVLTALRLDRSALGIELNIDYAELGRQRVIQDAPLFNTSEKC